MRVPAWMFIIGLVAFIAMTALCSVVSFSVAREFVINTEDSGIELPSFQDFAAAQPTPSRTAPPATVTNTPPPGVTFTPAPTTEPAEEAVNIAEANDPLAEIEPWNDLSRITILLMGIDQRSAVEERGPFRTDTMILVQIDPIQKRAGVLSIPRDLWVDVPGYGGNRITRANYLGDLNELPGGGPVLAMDTVRANLGVQVDYFVRVNFEVFETVVDTLAPNGVEVCPQERIHDDKYPDAGYGFIVVTFEPGCQRLQSERLLQYARTRATQGSDFDRNLRQQEVLKGLQREVLSAGGILNFVTQIPALYSQLSDSYQTNLPLDEILSLAKLTSEIGQDDVTFKAINNLHVDFGMTEDGTQQILIPRQDSIRFVVQEAFNPVTGLSLADLRQRAEDEAAQIVVYNNTSISGLAGQTREWLTGRGVTVSAVGNIEPPADATAITIRDYTGKPWTAQYLAALMNLPADAVVPGRDGLTSADVMVVVGSDVQTLLGGGE